MGHDIGLSESYYKPTEKEVLADYLKAMPLLTINYDNDKSALQKQVTELQENSKEERYFMIGKLAEKEREAEDTKKRLADLEQKFERFLLFSSFSFYFVSKAISIYLHI